MYFAGVSLNAKEFNLLMGGILIKNLTCIVFFLILFKGISFSQMNAVLVQQSNSRYFTAEEVAIVNSFPFTGKNRAFSHVRKMQLIK